MDPHPISQESMADLPDFFAEQGVELVSSLPYYQEYFTDKQRGQGVFEKSLASIRLLNERGYGTDESSLRLNLVYNPVGAFLPASQQSLEQDFKRELWQKFQLRFNHLFTITNMPIHRFKAQLVKLGGYEAYMEKLMAAFNPATVSGLMCRSMVSVSETGELYDCDFNQMLRLSTRGVTSLFDFDAARLQEREIVVGDHCYGCTAGAGSSCGGAVS
jgi:radical SAM/Cys-rich protein